MSDFQSTFGFQDCWSNPSPRRSVRSRASGYFYIGTKGDDGSGAQAGAGGGKGQTISPADKARLARVVNKAPEVMVKVSRPAKMDKHGKPISVNRGTEAARVSAHIEYISRNGKLDLETSEGFILRGKGETSDLYRDWMDKHDEDRANGFATDRTRITTSIILSMPGNVSASAVQDAARALAKQEFGGRHDYAMALHTDTKHPHVHLTVRTVGHDGTKLNLRKNDLQHLRDVFAQKLRHRGIEAESTPRHARGVTRKSERTPVYKIRQRGITPYVDTAKQRQVRQAIQDNGGRLPHNPWDEAIINRRNRVMQTYSNASKILEASDDPSDKELARSVMAFSKQLTDVRTERATIALRDVQTQPEGRSKAMQRALDRAARGRGHDLTEKRPEQERGPSKER